MTQDVKMSALQHAAEQASPAAIFSPDAYSPAEIEEKVEKLGVKKTSMPLFGSFMLAVVAGGSIALGALYFCIVLADPRLSFAIQRVLGGAVFTLGLTLVMIAGGELFTGNCMVVVAAVNRHISAAQVLRNWAVVWLGNAVGALALVLLAFMAHQPEMNNGEVGAAILKLAVSKVTPDGTTIFFKGVLCNLLVCLGVWLSYAGRSAGDKVVAMILPVSAFIAAGFEHCVANMYLLPMAFLLKSVGHVPAGLDVSAITVPGILHNLAFATLGNIVGGSVMVAGVYWVIYRRTLGGQPPLPPRKG